MARLIWGINWLTSQAKEFQDRANALASTEQATPLGSKFVNRPGFKAPQDNEPAPITADTPRSTVDPNTGKVMTNNKIDLGHQRTGGYAPDIYPDNALPTGEDAKVKLQATTNLPLEKEFLETSQNTQMGIQPLLKFAAASKQIESGGTRLTQAEYANILSGLGLTNAANDVMSKPNVEAAYTATKAALDSAITQSQTAFSKPTQSEFSKVQDKGSPNIDNPSGSNHSLVASRLGAQLWQNALRHDWLQAKAQGVQNFAGFLDRWRVLNPMEQFEDSADRLIGNFKGMDLPSPDRITEGSVYVVPSAKSKDNKSETTRQYALNQGLKPGDIFVAHNVQHDSKKGKVLFDFAPVNPDDTYRTMLSAPGVQYGE